MLGNHPTMICQLLGTNIHEKWKSSLHITKKINMHTLSCKHQTKQLTVQASQNMSPRTMCTSAWQEGNSTKCIQQKFYEKSVGIPMQTTVSEENVGLWKACLASQNFAPRLKLSCLIDCQFELISRPKSVSRPL